jgi:NAD(P)-dependent dehydrogenase (short-subunit alcohol dehydrogenase family)
MTNDLQTSRPTSFPDEPHQPRPGLTTEMRTKPDHGEDSYVGKGLLKNKIALITGGDSGIGRAVAIAYSREGADVAISYLADEQVDAEETRAWVEKAGQRCLLLPGDIRDRDHCALLVERTVAEFGRLDVLVNNAAAQTINGGLDTIDDDEMQEAFAANDDPSGESGRAAHEAGISDHQHDKRAGQGRKQDHDRLCGHEGRDIEPNGRIVQPPVE